MSDPLLPTTEPSTPGPLTIQSTTTLPTSWNDAPLEAVLAAEPLVHQMSPQELAEYIKRCATLRSSAQTRKAALVKEADGETKKPRKAKAKDSVSQAMDLLKQLTGGI